MSCCTAPTSPGQTVFLELLWRLFYAHSTQ
nr:MAG TPA: hypothetical protein [Caudoviricetes sp.]